MHTQRSYTNLLCLALLTSLPACIGIAGNGHRTTETRDLSDFTQIESDGPFDIDVTQGDNFEVKVSIDSNVLGRLKTRVRNHTLEIDEDGNVFDLVRGPHVIVTMPHLEQVDITGSGDLFARGFAETEAIHLHTTGSGNLTFQGSAPHITASIEGSGDMRLAGDSESAELTISGSGDLDALDLVTSEAEIDVDGSGDLRATVNGSVDVTMDGSGDVDLFGDVHEDHVSRHGSGDLKIH